MTSFPLQKFLLPPVHFFFLNLFFVFLQKIDLKSDNNKICSEYVYHYLYLFDTSIEFFSGQILFCFKATVH